MKTEQLRESRTNDITGQMDRGHTVYDQCLPASSYAQIQQIPAGKKFVIDASIDSDCGYANGWSADNGGSFSDPDGVLNVYDPQSLAGEAAPKGMLIGSFSHIDAMAALDANTVKHIFAENMFFAGKHYEDTARFKGTLYLLCNSPWPNNTNQGSIRVRVSVLP